jgi:hypothetical protein
MLPTGPEQPRMQETGSGSGVLRVGAEEFMAIWGSFR